MATLSFVRWTSLGFFSMLAAAACGASPEGTGIGWPEVQARAPGATHAIRLSRLRPPTSRGDANAYLELINDSQTDIDTSSTPFWVQSLAGSVQLPAQVWAQGTAVQLDSASVAPLDLHAAAGDLLVLGPDLTVEAYANWGADPNTLPGGYSDVAQNLGLYAGWAPLPYPVAQDVALNLDKTRATVPCVSADRAASAPFAAANCQVADPGPLLVLSRVQPSGLDPYGPAIEIKNNSALTLDVQGVQLCLRGACAPIVPVNQNPNDQADTFVPPPAAVAQGAPDPSRRRIVLRGGQALSDDDLVTSLPPVRSVDEVVLLAPGRTFAESAAWWSYVRLSPDGATLTGQSADALAATPFAAWQNVTLPGPRTAGECLALVTADDAATPTPASYRLDAQAFGTALVDPNKPYDACSAPLRQVPTSLTFNRVVHEGSTWLIELINLSEASIPLERYSLGQGETIRPLYKDGTTATLTALAPNQTFWVVAPTDQADCDTVHYDACWPAPEFQVTRNEFSVLRDNQVVAHIQWGTEATSLRGEAALQAGVWPASRCRMGALPSAPYAAIVRLPRRPGRAPTDFALTTSESF